MRGLLLLSSGPVRLFGGFRFGGRFGHFFGGFRSFHRFCDLGSGLRLGRSGLLFALAHHAHLDGALDVAVDGNGHFMLAGRLDGLAQLDAALVDVDVGLLLARCLLYTSDAADE